MSGWDATDQLTGGAGFDYVYSETSANVNIAFGANSLIDIEEIFVSQHFNLGSFTFVMHDANVAAGPEHDHLRAGAGAANPCRSTRAPKLDGTLHDDRRRR
ncbi:MAG: hypothetical protein R3D01_11135 [Hyphomicrobiales bacterium]